MAVMTASDVKDCADLFLAANGSDIGWDREAGIAESLRSSFPFPM